MLVSTSNALPHVLGSQLLAYRTRPPNPCMCTCQRQLVQHCLTPSPEPQCTESPFDHIVIGVYILHAASRWSFQAWVPKQTVLQAGVQI